MKINQLLLKDKVEDTIDRVYVFRISSEDTMDEDKSIIVLRQSGFAMIRNTDRSSIKVISITRTRQPSDQKQTYM